MDYDYSMKMERLNISTHDFNTGKWSQVMLWRDFSNVSFALQSSAIVVVPFLISFAKEYGSFFVC